MIEPTCNQLSNYAEYVYNTLFCATIEKKKDIKIINNITAESFIFDDFKNDKSMVLLPPPLKRSFATDPIK